MSGIRSILGPIAAVWLVSQVAILALVPALLWFQPTSASLAACACVHGAEGACPMHHGSGAGSKVCVMQRTTDTATATLLGLLGGLGLVSQFRVARQPVATTSAVRLDSFPPTPRPVPPDPPPPRA
jgi:hypothetical protein